MQKSKLDRIVYYSSVLIIFDYFTNEEKLAICFELTKKITDITKKEIKDFVIGVNTDNTSIQDFEKIDKVNVHLYKIPFIWSSSTLKNLDKVVNFNISNFKIDDSAVKIICKANFLSLTSLHLENNSISNLSINYFNNESMPVLKYLNLSRNKLHCIKVLLEMILKNLIYLDLSYNCNKNYTTIKYLNTGERYSNLKQLNISACKLSKNDISTFTSLVHFKKLKILNIKNNKLLDNHSLFILNRKFQTELESEEEEISSILETIKFNDSFTRLKRFSSNENIYKVKILLSENNENKSEENNRENNINTCIENEPVTETFREKSDYLEPNYLEDPERVQECMKNLLKVKKD
jgi:hypothetical protein